MYKSNKLTREFLDCGAGCEMDPSYPKLKIVSPIDGSISNLQEESQHSCSCTDRTDISLTETGYDLGLYVTGKIINDLAFGIWH